MKKLLPFLLLLGTALGQTNVARMLNGVNYQVGTSYTFVAADTARVTQFNNASPVAVSLPAASTAGFQAGVVISARNAGAGAATITCSSCTINGSATLTIAAGSSADIYSDGTNYVANTGITPAFNAITSGTNTTAAMVVGTGASLTTTALGQNIGTQLWWTPGAPLPSVTMTLTGGSLQSSHSAVIQVTFNSAAGETLPGPTTQGGYVNSFGSTCSSGTACTLTVAAPTLPAGYTGYTVYICDVGTLPCTPGREIASGSNPSCVNITTNCTVVSPVGLGSGAALPTIGTAFLSPTPQGANICPPGLNPFLFLSDGTNFFPYAGVESINTGTNPPAPYTRLMFCRPVYMTDVGLDLNGQPPTLVRKGYLNVQHLQNGVTTAIGNQDPGIDVQTANCVPVGSCADSATHYAFEGIQVEQDVSGTPTINGSPDGEISAGSFQTALNIGANVASNGYGTNAIRAQLFRQGAGVDTNGLHGVLAIFSNTTTSSGSGAQAAGVVGECSSGFAVTSLFCAAFIASLQGGGGQFSGQQALYLGPTPGLNPSQTLNGDYFIRNDNFNLQSNMGGNVFLQQILNSDVVPVTIGSEIQLNGSLTTAQQAAGIVSNITCSGGTAQYSYVEVGIDTNGGAVSSTTFTGPATCAAPLTSGNPATLGTNLQVSNSMGQFSRYDIYRTSGGGMSTGKIGSVTVTGGGGITTCQHGSYSGTFNCTNNGNIVDTGIAADGTTPPTVNTTGGITTPVNAISHFKGNLFQVASNFTTAANTNLQTITGLVLPLPQVAANYSFHCSLAYSQATANAAVAFGVQSASVAPTNIFATGTEQTNTTAYAGGTLPTLTTTTATNIVSATPGATATNFTTTLDGTIEEPQFNAGNSVNIMVSTATAGDAVTVLRGSYCRLY